MNIQEVVKIITNNLGISDILPSKSGIYHFLFDKDINIDLFALNSTVSIIFGIIFPMSENSPSKNAEVIKDCARLAVAACKKRNSIVSVDENAIILHRTIQNDQSEEELTESMRSFVYDMHWWKSQLDKHTDPISPFTGTGGVWIAG